jgi:hypothetical protein
VVSTGGAPIYSTADGLNWTQQGEQDIIYMWLLLFAVGILYERMISF